MAGQSGKPIYIFDTSAWIECNERAGDNRIPAMLDALHNEKRIKCPKEVFRELGKPGQISDWAKKNRRGMVEPRGLPADYAVNLGKVQHSFPGMGKATGHRERADPYVVALALTKDPPGQEGWVVVTSEHAEKRPRRKIKGACDELGLSCISLDEVLAREMGNDENAEGK